MANISSSTWTATGVWDPGYLKEHFILGATRQEAQYPKCFKVMNSDRQNERFASFYGMTSWSSKTEGGDISFQTPGEAYAKTFTHTTYASGFNYTLEAQEDQQHRELEQLAEDLGMGAFNLIETTTANHFNRAFNGSYTGPDAVALCVSNHPIPATGGTESNILSSAADLAYTSLQQAMADLMGQVDGAGKLAPMRPSVLIVSPSEEVTARQILNSAVTSSALQVNVFQGMLNLVVWPYLTDADAWFLMCPEHRMYFFWRRPLVFKRWADDRSETESYAGSMRFSSGWADWRGVFGTAGAG